MKTCPMRLLMVLTLGKHFRYRTEIVGNKMSNGYMI